MNGLGPTFLKIWTCGRSPRSGSRNAWTRIKNAKGASRLSQFSNFFVRSDTNHFLLRLVTMEETWLYHYDPETKQQSMEWRHSGTYSLQKIPNAKILWKGFRLNFVGSRRPRFTLSIFQRAKLSTRSTTHLCWCNWRTFWRKNVAGRTPTGSCPCTTMPRLTEHLHPRRNWPIWAFRKASSDLTPSDYHLFPGLKK